MKTKLLLIVLIFSNFLFAQTNLSLKKLSASSGGSSSSQYAFDGSNATFWNSGDYAPAWISVDLGSICDVNYIDFNVAQLPAGNTIHEIYSSIDGVNWLLVETINSYTTDKTEFTRFYTNLNAIRYIKVLTTSSPSWIAWHEISVYGKGDLVAYYPFNGNANDVSGYLNNGTVNGASLTTDRFDKPNSAYEFNGIDNFILVPHSNSLDITGSELTISMWLYNENPETNLSWKGISKGGYDVNNGYELIFTNGNTNGNASLNIGGGGYFTNSFNSFNNQWIMITGTYKDGVGTMYINGIIQPQSQQGGINLISSLSDLYIGKRNPANNFAGFVKGKIDEVRIYKTALSAIEISDLYTNSSLNLQSNKRVDINQFYVFDNALYFYNQQNISEIKTVEVYNLLGQIIFNTSKITNPISLNTLQKGIYILKVLSINEKDKTLKFSIE